MPSNDANGPEIPEICLHNMHNSYLHHCHGQMGIHITSCINMHVANGLTAGHNCIPLSPLALESGVYIFIIIGAGTACHGNDGL